jgi:hypothetical protein
MKYPAKTSIVIFFLLILTGCNLKKEVLISGRTMGTTYNIKVVTWFYKNNVGFVKIEIDEKILFER